MSVIDPISIYTGQLWEELSKHIEEFACAFQRTTNLPPDKIVMFHATEWVNGHLVNRIWFEEKKDE